jgi:hypothetical protein
VNHPVNHVDHGDRRGPAAPVAPRRRSPRLWRVIATRKRPATASPSQGRSRARQLLALTLAAPLLAACSVNFGAQTDQVYTPAVGVNNRDNDVDVLNALIVAEENGSGRLIAGLSNSTDEEVELTGVAGDGSDVQFGTDGGDGVVPPGGFLQLADEGAALISATGEDVVIGAFVRLTMSFSNGDQVGLNVPVVVPGEDFAEVELPAGSGGTDGPTSETETESELETEPDVEIETEE